MSSLSSPGWSVHPSFVPHGPTSPVTLLFDDDGLTQLAGVYPVAWQTPWSEISHPQLVRTARSLALFATIGDVRYIWRTGSLEDYEDLREIVLAHGGEASRKRRRAGALVAASVLLLASFAGGIAAWFSGGTTELAQAQAVNLTITDLGPGFSVTPTSVLGFIFPPANQVVTSTPTTAAPVSSSWTRAIAAFQTCLGVSNATDRVYGAAGQMPDYQVSSPIFSSTNYGGIQLASTSQYYATTAMVDKDVAEMSRAGFGACFARSNADLVYSGATGSSVSLTGGVSWDPITYARGWSRGGVADLTVPGGVAPLHLVMVVAAKG
ncbi:MAG TPA: hypothetical protein VLT61_08950, partial [Anaeromyxobacteraceae bacterium]|nr:hypothetical protein [Anaeromyxobacteraceae bacterium]